MRMVALLRGVNVAGARKLPMSELRELAIEVGWNEVATYIQSGNLVFESGRTSAKSAEVRLERAIEERFGFAVDVVVRTAREWLTYVSENPFIGAARDRPSLVHLGVSKKPCKRAVVEALAGNGTQGERVKVVGDAIWVDFVESVGRSKLTPALFDKSAGSPVTMRNWRTVLMIEKLLEAS